MLLVVTELLESELTEAAPEVEWTWNLTAK